MPPTNFNPLTNRITPIHVTFRRPDLDLRTLLPLRDPPPPDPPPPGAQLPGRARDPAHPKDFTKPTPNAPKHERVKILCPHGESVYMAWNLPMSFFRCYCQPEYMREHSEDGVLAQGGFMVVGGESEMGGRQKVEFRPRRVENKKDHDWDGRYWLQVDKSRAWSVEQVVYRVEELMKNYLSALANTTTKALAVGCTADTSTALTDFSFQQLSMTTEPIPGEQFSKLQLIKWLDEANRAVDAEGAEFEELLRVKEVKRLRAESRAKGEKWDGEEEWGEMYPEDPEDEDFEIEVEEIEEGYEWAGGGDEGVFEEPDD